MFLAFCWLACFASHLHLLYQLPLLLRKDQILVVILNVFTMGLTSTCPLTIVVCSYVLLPHLPEATPTMPINHTYQKLLPLFLGSFLYHALSTLRICKNIASFPGSHAPEREH